MSELRIVADSTCDLSQELIVQYGISILPLNIVLDMTSYCDGEEITPDEIYVWSEKNKRTPKTAAVAFDRALALLQEMKDKGDEVIFIGISGEMSTTCNVLRLVRDELDYDRMFIIDSGNLSTGIGLLVLRAAELAEKGLPAEEIAADIQAARDKVRASFVVERLDYLAMGGRCSTVTALLGGKLNLKPRIEVSGGKMAAGKKYRGAQDKVILKYVQDMKENLREADCRRVFITHSGCPEEVISQVKHYLEDLQVFEDIHITRAGGVISSHCGPGTLGVLYFTH